MPQPFIDRAVDSQGWLEPVADFFQRVIGGFYSGLGRPGQALKDVLHGTKLLGHPLHPAVTDIPLGAWLAGSVADWLALSGGLVPVQAGDIALAVGLAGALLSAASGYTDFHETYGHERRLAVAHGLIMTVVVILQALSLGLRFGAGPDVRPTAVIVATAGLLLALSAAYIGGHLTFGLGTMVNRTAFLEMPEDFVAVGHSSDFPEGKMCRVDAGHMAVLVTRLGGRLCAIANTCSHAGGPLNEGTLEGEVVTCPWHASRFSVCDGGVKGGPASFPQPMLLVREQDGVVEVCPEVLPH